MTALIIIAIIIFLIYVASRKKNLSKHYSKPTNFFRQQKSEKEIRDEFMRIFLSGIVKETAQTEERERNRIDNDKLKAEKEIRAKIETDNKDNAKLKSNGKQFFDEKIYLEAAFKSIEEKAQNELKDTDAKLKAEPEIKAKLVCELKAKPENETIIATSNISNSLNDESIFDITDQSIKINSDGNLRKFIPGIPNWAHHYVYSFSEINSATKEQKEFYGIFKKSFLKGEYIDIEGNTNYAFILLYDLLNEFESHNDIPRLENQLKTLGQYYPKTKSYGVSFLIQKMSAMGDKDGVSRFLNENRNSSQNDSYNYDYWKLGSKYKSKLQLNEEDVILLNRIWSPGNNFCSIEYCCLEVLKLYIALMSELKGKYTIEGSTIDEQFLAVAVVIATNQFNYKNGSQNYKFCIATTISEFYSHIFKLCENAVREYYGHKRKINTDTHYTKAEAKTEFETRIISKVTELLPVLISKVTPPNEATNIELNSQNTNRWKIQFEELTTNYTGKPKEFIDSIISLGKLNFKNPSIENIFFEASKFIAKYDKQAALYLYVHYLYHDLKSATFDNRKFTTTIQKNLFKTTEQLHDFEIIVSELINDKNLEKALMSVAKVYEVKRKKIQLDSKTIIDVQQKHSGTVELLNEYLKDEYEDETNAIKTQESGNEEIEIVITQKNEPVQSSAFITEISFSTIHITTLELFSKSNFSIPQIELEAFAKSKGVFKNQLIESINETCYDFLDDILIEEEDDYYTINTNYFQRISAK